MEYVVFDGYLHETPDLKDGTILVCNSGSFFNCFRVLKIKTGKEYDLLGLFTTKDLAIYFAKCFTEGK